MQLTDKQKKKAERIIKLVEEGNLAIAEHLFDIEEKFDEHIQKLQTEFKERVDEIRGSVPDLDAVLDSIKGKNGYTPEKGKDYFDGEPGKDYVITEKDIKEIATKVKVPIVEKVVEIRTETVVKEQPIITQVTKEVAVFDEKKLEAELPKYGEQYRDALELLKGEDRLDKSAIKDLEEDLKKLRSEIVNRGGPRGAVIRNKIRSASLTSQCDGVTKAFTLPTKTLSVVGVFSTQFPVILDSNDWTFSGRTLTLGASVGAPQSGQVLWALYESLN